MNREWYWKRTSGWKWFDGLEHWWEVFLVPSGWNGLGGLWIEERWRWNGSTQTMRTEIRTLTPEATQAVFDEIPGLRLAVSKR